MLASKTCIAFSFGLFTGCGCAVAVLLVAVSVLTAVLASILLATLWIHLIRLPHPSKLPIRQASTIILGDFNSFYYDKVYAGIDEKSLTNATRDLNYNIDVYGIQGACVDIHKHGVYNYFDQVVVTEKNISNFIPVYALSGSFFNYQLYGSTSNMSLQNKFVEVCLNRGASYDDGEKLDCVKMPLFKGVGRYEITDPGYFFFTVQSLNGKAEYSLNVSGTIKKIHVSTDKMLGCGLSRSNLTCHIVLPAKGNTYCLLAEFYKLTHHFMLTELDVRVEKTRASHILGISLPPLIVFVLLVCLSGLGIIFIKCVCVYQRNKQSWHMLTYSI